MQTELISCLGWHDFKNKVSSRLFGSDVFQRGVFLFRGQTESNWPLQSSYDRWFTATGRPESERVPVAEELLEHFQRELNGLAPGSESASRVEKLALAQHYGLPTRLLDWSESPYISGFFAFADALQKGLSKGTVGILALDTRSYAWRGRGVTIVKVAADRNLRLRNQDGRFTLLESAVTSLEEHLLPLSSEDPWPLYKFTIPVTEARLALSELDLMGINACRLFPDLTGCSLNAKLTTLLKKPASSTSSGTPR